MKRRNSKLLSLIFVASDTFFIILAFTLAYVIRVQIDNKPIANMIGAMDYIKAFFIVTPIWIIVFALLGLYNQGVYNYRLREWGRLFLGTAIGIMAIISFEYLTMIILFPAKLVAIYSFVISFGLLLFGRELIRLVRNVLHYFGVGIKRVLVIGESAATYDIVKNLAHTRRTGYRVIAMAGPKKFIPENLQLVHYSSTDKALKNIESLAIDTIIQTDLYSSAERNQRILGAAQTHHIRYNFIPGEPEFYTGKNTVDVFLGYPMITVSQTPLVGWGAMAKRVFDQVVSTVLVILLSPVFLVLILLQKLLNPGPVFYVSKRLSQFSKPVRLYKFRSMKHRATAHQDAADEFRAMGREDLAIEYEKNRKVANDPRITWFGKFLRDTSLDELPQIFNVLKGDLSLVGPRPILPQEVKFGKSRAALLHSVKSGVTGLWQVSGRNDLDFDERIELELYYAQNWSFWLDIKILFKTVAVVIRRTGAK